MLNENVTWDYFVNTAGGLTAAILFIVSVLIWNKTIVSPISWLRLRRLRIERKSALGVMVCNFEMDGGNTLSKLIVTNLRQNYCASTREDDEIIVVERFNITLAAVSDRSSHEAATLSKALAWMHSANADVIIWGHRVQDDGLHIVQIMGRRSGAVITKQLKIAVAPSAFNDEIADAITREVIAITTDLYKDPAAVSTYQIKQGIAQAERLISANLAGFDVETEIHLRSSIDFLLNSACLHAKDFNLFEKTLENSRFLLDLHSNVSQHEYERYLPAFARNLARCVWIGEAVSEGEATLRKCEAILERSKNHELVEELSKTYIILRLIYEASKINKMNSADLRVTPVYNDGEISFDILPSSKKDYEDISMSRLWGVFNNRIDAINKSNLEQYIKYRIVMYCTDLFYHNMEGIREEEFQLISINLKNIYLNHRGRSTLFSIAMKLIFLWFSDFLVANHGYQALNEGFLPDNPAKAIEEIADEMYHSYLFLPASLRHRRLIITLIAAGYNHAAEFRTSLYLYRKAERCFQEAVIQCGSDDYSERIDCQRQRCVILNTIGILELDEKSIEESISIISNLRENSVENIDYYEAFALYVKAEIGLHKQKIRKEDAISILSKAENLCLLELKRWKGGAMHVDQKFRKGLLCLLEWIHAAKLKAK